MKTTNASLVQDRGHHRGLTDSHTAGGGAAHLHGDEGVLHHAHQVISDDLTQLLQADPVET